MRNLYSFLLLSLLATQFASGEEETKRQIELIQTLPVEAQDAKLASEFEKAYGSRLQIKQTVTAMKIAPDVFQNAVKSAVRELENTMVGTCAKEMTASLKIDAKGSWQIIEVGLGGTLEVKISNPEFGKKCFR
jgi:hypothetical protein